MAQGSTFEQRLHAILDVGRNRRPTTTKTVLLVLAIELARNSAAGGLAWAGPEPPKDGQGAAAAQPSAQPAPGSVTAAPTVAPAAAPVAAEPLIATRTVPDVEGPVWTESLNQFARNKRAGPEFAPIGLHPYKNSWVNPRELSSLVPGLAPEELQRRMNSHDKFLPADAPIETIAAMTKRGDLYVPEPDVIQPIHGTLLAPLAVQSSPTGDKSVLLEAIAKTSCEELIKEIVDYAMQPRGEQRGGLQVKAGDAFGLINASGRLFVMGAFGPPDALQVQIILIGYSSIFSAVTERIIFPAADEEQGFAFFDFESGQTLKPPFAPAVCAVGLSHAPRSDF